MQVRGPEGEAKVLEQLQRFHFDVEHLKTQQVQLRERQHQHESQVTCHFRGSALGYSKTNLSRHHQERFLQLTVVNNGHVQSGVMQLDDHNDDLVNLLTSRRIPMSASVRTWMAKADFSGSG